MCKRKPYRTPKERVLRSCDARAERRGRKAWRVIQITGRKGGKVLGKHVSAAKAWADAAKKLGL